MRLIIALLLLLPLIAITQNNAQKHDVVFITTGSVGIIGGESDVKPLLQLVSGIKYKKYSAGAGFGLDEYRFRSLPLFAHLRMHFGRKQAVFIYTDGGYNFPSNVKSENEGFKTTDKYKGGLFIDLGLGFRIIDFAKWHSLLFSAGYTYKQIRNITGYTYPCFAPPCSEEIYRYNYGLGRITAKLSWNLER